MTLLTREAVINSKPTFEMVEVDVTEWGAIDPETGERQRTTVFVREMTVREKNKFIFAGATIKGRKLVQEDGMDIDAVKSFEARLAVATCCDANGNPIFTSEDIEHLLDKPVKVLSRICDAALKLNRLNKEDLENEEETVKN